VPPFEVQVHPCSAPAGPAAGEARVPSLGAHGAHGSFWVDAEQASAVEALLFGGTGRPAGMGAAIAQQALVELIEALADAAPRACPQEVIDLSVPGRALADVRIRCGGHTLALLVELPDPNLLPLHAAEARPRSASYAAALLPHPVTVHASLGAVEVDLGALHMLRPGDILRLDKRLDEPVELDIAGERLCCEAYLVASGGRKAVELNRANPSTKASPHA
jgi:flagellar motor switch/type III secretory pathway protein FliN